MNELQVRYFPFEWVIPRARDCEYVARHANEVLLGRAAVIIRDLMLAGY